MTETVQGSTRSPTMEEVLRTAIEYFLEDTHVALPGRVEVYDASKQKVDVKPLIKRRIGTEEGEELLEELPIITDVPVIFPRSSTFFITFPIAAGDHVMLVFNERSIDKFVAGQGEDTDPDDFRMHDLSDAVAYPGFYPDVKALTDADSENMVLGLTNGVQIHIKPGGEIHLGSKDAADALALASKVDADLSTIKSAIAGAAVFPGDGGALFKTNIGIGLAGIPTGSASSVVKSD